MKLKRFFAPDIRQAMSMVREELGPDAVIMSNRKVENGVEIVAAKDFDEQTVHEKATKEPEAKPVKNRQPVEAKKSNQSKPKARAKKVSIEKKPVRTKVREQIKVPEQPVDTTSSANIIDSKIKRVLRKSSKTRVTKSRKKPLANSQFSGEEFLKQEQSVASDPILIEMHHEIKMLKDLLDSRLQDLPVKSQSVTHNLTHRIIGQLLAIGVPVSLADQLTALLDQKTDLATAWQTTFKHLVDTVPLAEDHLLEKGGIVALVGPTGVGKTTTIAKLAAQFRLKHGRGQVALITTDNYRIAAHEQLNTYGRLLEMPVHAASDHENLQQVLQRFADKRLILIDTVGMSQRDQRLAEQLALLRQQKIDITTVLVMSANTQSRAVNEIIESFHDFEPEACILTKFDEAVVKGAVFASLIEHQLPLAYFTDGQQVPEDLHEPESFDLLSQCAEELNMQENDFASQSLPNINQPVEGYA
ncbi:MAG: flagellar biosynthesis protein FlhF [Methylococcaceae bacterium]